MLRRCLVLTALALLAFPAFAAGEVARLVLDAPIHPITAAYLVEGIQAANARGASLILIEMDTPGGYVSSVEQVQKAILASRAPVVTYVTPAGARAASGGAFIALTSDLIAMAPNTSIGAAHPVGGGPIPLPTQPPVTPPGGEDKGGEKKAPGAEGAVEMQKLVNDLAAHMRSLAVNRHRNAEVAENMVRESVSLTEREALDAGLIELVAKNRSEVFAFLREHPIYRSDGSRETLALGENLAVEDIPMSARERFLTGLANPALAYVLLLLGALGLFVEFKSPGLIFPGIIGAIFILLYLMSIPLLPVNVVGLLLILLGIVFFILEVKVVSYGMLTVGGVVSLVLGSVLLYDKAPIPELRLSLTVILPVALAFSGIIVFLLVLAARAMRNPVKTGEEGFVGKVGEVREAIEPPGEGKVFVFGEYWTAVSDAPIGAGERVRVVECRGMTVKVEPLSKGGSRA